MKYFTREVIELSNAIEQDYHEHLLSQVSHPDINDIQRVKILQREVDSQINTLLGSCSDVTLFVTRIKLGIANRALSFAVNQLEVV